MTDTSSTTTTTSTVTSSGASFSALGIGSGLDLQSIVKALVTEYSQPQTSLKTSLAKHTALVTNYQSLNTQFTAIKTAAQNLNLGFDWLDKTASSTDTSVTATATNAANKGSFSFQVNKLASAENMASYGSVSSLSSVVGGGNLLIGAGGKLGLGSISSSSGLSTGDHTVTVTQASNGATSKGSALADSVTLTGSETLTYSVDGAAKSITLDAGTYSQKQLAAMVQTKSNGTLNVAVNSDKSLQVTSAHEGSSASMSITGGTGLSKLGLATTGTLAGTDGIVTVDGVSNTVNSIMPDGSNTVTLNSTAGSINASFGGGLRVGTSTLSNVSTGGGTLQNVVDAINGSNAGISATAVQVGPGQFKLQMQSSTTGSDGQISTNFSAFESTLGHLTVVTAAQNAEIQIGTGANAFTVSSSSNQINGAIPGVTLNVTKADPNNTITVNVGGDVKGLETKVKALVDAVNATQTYISDNSKYDSSSKTAGALLGNYTAQNLQSQIASAMSSQFGGAGDLSGVGITQNEDGTYTFDTTKFETAYNADPEKVASTFVDGGSKVQNLSGKAGIAERLTAIASNATNALDGSLATAIKGENSTITLLNTQIDDWTTRIQRYQDMLIQQFSAADTLVSNLKSQQTYLSGQITALQNQS